MVSVICVRSFGWESDGQFSGHIWGSEGVVYNPLRTSQASGDLQLARETGLDGNVSEPAGAEHVSDDDVSECLVSGMEDGRHVSDASVYMHTKLICHAVAESRLHHSRVRTRKFGNFWIAMLMFGSLTTRRRWRWEKPWRVPGLGIMTLFPAAGVSKVVLKGSSNRRQTFQAS